MSHPYQRHTTGGAAGGVVTAGDYSLFQTLSKEVLRLRNELLQVQLEAQIGRASCRERV